MVFYAGPFPTEHEHVADIKNPVCNPSSTYKPLLKIVVAYRLKVSDAV